MIEIYINWMDRWTQKITLVHVGSLVTILVCTRHSRVSNEKYTNTQLHKYANKQIQSA